MQLKFGDAEGLDKRTRWEFSLAEVYRVVPWNALLALSDAALEEDSYGTPMMRRFARMDSLDDIPVETIPQVPPTAGHARSRPIVVRTRELASVAQGAQPVQPHDRGCPDNRHARLDQGRRWLARSGDAPDEEGQPAALRHQGAHWCGRSIRVDALRRMHSEERGRCGVGHKLPHGKEGTLCSDSDYSDAGKREELHQLKAGFWIAQKLSHVHAIRNKREGYFKSSIRAMVECRFRVIKWQFGYAKVRYHGLAKNAAQLLALFALSNLWMVCKLLLPAIGQMSRKIWATQLGNHAGNLALETADANRAAFGVLRLHCSCLPWRLGSRGRFGLGRGENF